MAISDNPTVLGNTVYARKYVYVVNEITKTWRNTSFFLDNVKRMAPKYDQQGRQGIIPLETSGNNGFRFFTPGENLPESGSASYTEATIDFTSWAVTAEYDYHAKLANATNEQSFIRVRMKAVADAVEAMGYHWSHALMMPKTNAVARLKTNTTGNTWQLYKENESGANGTFGSRFLFRNGMVSASSTTTGLVCESAFDGTTLGVDYVNDKVTFAGMNPGSLNADDYIYWGTKNRPSKGRGLTGLPVIVDDGTNYAVFEGRNRTTAGNEDWQAGYTGSFGTGNIELEMINQAINQRRRLPGSKTDVVLYGMRTQRMHFQQQSTAKMSMLPVSSIKGGPVFNGGWSGLPVFYADGQMIAMATEEYPDNVMYGLNWEGVALAMMPGGEPTWINEGEGDFKYIDDTTNWRAYLVAVGQLVSKNPALNWQTAGIVSFT